MPVLPPSVQYTAREYAYLAWHKNWRLTRAGVTGGDLIYKRVAIDNSESQLISGNYRPRKQNPATLEMRDAQGRLYTQKAGADLSAQMWNYEFSRVSALPDEFVVFHPLDALELSLLQADDEPTRPFARWSYGVTNPKKTDASIKLAEIKAEIGPAEQIYDIDRSPYWKMMMAGVDVQDLPAPPADRYVSRLPPAPLKVNDAFGGAAGLPTGSTNALQKWLAENRLWTGGFDNYYGPRVVNGVKQVQLLLQRLGLWTGPVDGRQWSVELRGLIDDILEWDFLTLWG